MNFESQRAETKIFSVTFTPQLKTFLRTFAQSKKTTRKIDSRPRKVPFLISSQNLPCRS